MTDDDIIAVLVQRAEAGDGQAAVRLHKMSAAGIEHPALVPYQEWPRTTSRHKVRARPRGRPMPGTRYDADGNYIANSRNTLESGLPRDLKAALTIERVIEEGRFRGADALNEAAGRLVRSERTIQKYRNRGLARTLLALLRRR